MTPALRILVGVALLGLAGVSHAPAGGAQPAPATPRKLALLVSVSNYQAKHPSRKVIGEWLNLNCYLDTRNMRATLTAPRYGFADADVLVLDDLKATRAGQPVPGLAATREGMIAAFRGHLIAQARPGDVVVFLFSGHGNQIADQPKGQPGGGDEPDGYDEAFVPYDYAGTPEGDAKAYFRDDDLALLLKELKAKMAGPDGKVQGSINLIVDSCHSGTVTRGIRIAKGRGAVAQGPIEINAKGRAGGNAAHDEAPEGYVAMSACQSDESAFEATDEKNRPLGGALVYNLCRVMRQAPPRMTYRELFDRVRVHVKSAYFNQNPVVEGEVNRALFGGTVQALPEFPRVTEVAGERVTLGAGRLLGVAVGNRYALHPTDAAAAKGEGALGVVEVTEVDTYSAVAVLREPATPAERAKLTRQALLGRPAVLRSQAYGDGRLRVVLDGAANLAAALRAEGVAEAADPLQVATAAAGEQKYDFRITRTPPPGARPGHVYLMRDDDTLVAQVPDDARAGAALRRALVRQWRWRTLAALDDQEPTLEVRLRVVPVDVPRKADGTPDFAARRDRPATAVERNPQGHVVLHAGEYFRIELEYRGEAKFVWVSVLGLQQDGTIAPIFPSSGNAQESNRLSEDRRTLRPGGLFEVVAPFGLDVYKVIVTTQEVSFSALVDAPDNAEAPEEAEAKAARARGMAAGTRGNAAPLARLLLNASLGTRATSHVNVGQKDWSTSTVILETRAR